MHKSPRHHPVLLVSSPCDNALQSTCEGKYLPECCELLCKLARPEEGLWILIGRYPVGQKHRFQPGSCDGHMKGGHGLGH